MNWIMNCKLVNMKTTGIIVLILLSIWACSKDDHEDVIDTSRITPAESFTDPRDGQVYRCIQIGDQIWMAQNLNYYLPRGAYDGSYTWNESYYETSQVSISEEKFKEKLLTAIETGDFAPVYFQTVIGPMEMVVNNVKEQLERSWTSSQIIDELENKVATYSQYPVYADVVIEMKDRIEFLNNLIDKLVMEALPDFSREHFEEAEKGNSNYSSKYGLLYSYEGALAAVPEGWRLPDDNDWKQLERFLGMNEQELDAFDRWRGPGIGNFLKTGEKSIGFDALYGGCNAYTPAKSEQYIRLEENAYFWSSTLLPENDSTQVGIVRSLVLFEEGIMRTTTRLKGYLPVLYHVRCIKKEENE